MTLPRKVRVEFINYVTFGRISRGYQGPKRKKRSFKKRRMDRSL